MSKWRQWETQLSVVTLMKRSVFSSEHANRNQRAWKNLKSLAAAVLASVPGDVSKIGLCYREWASVLLIHDLLVF